MVKEFRQAKWSEPLIFEIEREGRIGHMVPTPSEEVRKVVGEVEKLIPEVLRRKKEPELPEVSEVEVVQHYTRLSQMNYGVDTGFYPLGSCTMKYNPRVNEELASMDEVAWIHPYQDESTVQGALELMYKLEKWLAEITGMHRFTLQPAAGAHGEYVGVQIIRAYHKYNGELGKRDEIIIPDSAHGTNPASAAMAGFNDAGGLLYYDGANLNAIVGKVRPGDMGFDIVHLNLHKTFGTPHGGGGPGAGPVGVTKELEKFLPVPLVEYDGKKYYLDWDRPYSIGKVKGFYGNFNVLVKAFAYILALGEKGLKTVAEISVLNTNYIVKKLGKVRGFELLYGKGKPRKHECVFSASPMKRDTKVKALNVAKRLLDFGIHAPTMYFPLIVHEALMIEPTETATKEQLDEFIEALSRISEEAYNNPEVVLSAPHNTSVTRLDEAMAARPKTLFLTWKMYLEKVGKK